MARLIIMMIFVSLAGFSITDAEAKSKNKNYHCEIKKNGKTIDDHSIKTRKACKKKGGKWVKDHGDHDHSHEGEDHDHEED